MPISRRRFVQKVAATLAGGCCLDRMGRAAVRDVPVPVRQITRGPKFHWFGYYDKLEFDPMDRYVLGMEVEFEHRSPRLDDVVKIGMVDLKDRDRWIELGRTTAWCWQQGCMLQWRPRSQTEVLWNDREGAHYVCRILDVRTRNLRTIPHPVYSVSPDGKWAVTTDFRRLGDTRPGYGYNGIPDPHQEELAPKESGIWHVDLETGHAKLVISLEQIARTPPLPGDLSKAKHWFNHLLVSPDGTRFEFLHRWNLPGKGIISGTRMFTAAPDGSAIRFLNTDTSHFNWRDPQHLLAWARHDPQGVGFFIFKDADGGAADLLLYVGKTDSWDENSRLLKLGRLRLRFSGNPFAAGRPFRQTLRLDRGEIEIAAGEGGRELRLRLWADANHPVVRIEAESDQDFELETCLEVWRNSDRVLSLPDGLAWCHRNQTSAWEGTMKHQDLAPLIPKFRDPLIGLSSGAMVTGENHRVMNNRTLRSRSPGKRFLVSVHPLVAQAPSVEDLLTQLRKKADGVNSEALERARTEHRAWWDASWARSRIVISGSSEAEKICQGYNLQRFLAACAGRGRYPIQFGGSIFTVDGTKETAGNRGGLGIPEVYDADLRMWGRAYWFQNTRLLYWHALMAGDFDTRGAMAPASWSSNRHKPPKPGRSRSIRFRMWPACIG